MVKQFALPWSRHRWRLRRSCHLVRGHYNTHFKSIADRWQALLLPTLHSDWEKKET
jgi:hypothetical protein